VSGQFGTVSGTAAVTNRAAVGATVTYGANSVTFAVVQLPFAGFALTPNQTAVANAAQASPELTVALDAVPLANQLPAAFNALSPQGYEIWSAIALADATALTDRLARDDGAIVGQDNYYFDVNQRRGRTQADLDVGTSTFTSTGVLIGGNRGLSSDLTVGGFFEHADTTADLASPGSRTSVKGNTFGVRAAGTQGPWFTHAVLAYGFTSYNSTRPVMFPGTAAVATSQTHGHQWIADLSGGHRFTFGDATISPYAGLLVSRWHANGFTESGAGAYDATVAGQSAHSLRTQLGVEGQLGWSVASMPLHPHVRAAWLHELDNGARTIDAAFGTIDYAVATRAPQRDSAQLGAGLDLVLGPRALLFTDYTTQTGGITRILSDWRVGLSVNF